jgi:hypothetical protein
LLAKGNLSSEQIAYLEAYTVTIGESVPAVEPVTESTPAPAEASSTTSEEYMIKGKTTFGELITLGVPQVTIEGLIGMSMPDPAMTVKAFASANGLDFETLKPALQAEVDKVKP